MRSYAKNKRLRDQRRRKRDTAGKKKRERMNCALKTERPRKRTSALHSHNKEWRRGAEEQKESGME